MNRNQKTPDDQWAEKLGIPKYTPPTPPPTPAPQTPRPNPGSFPPPPEPSPQHEENQCLKPQTGQEDNQGPQPPSYLIWSILCTLLCCFIPGVIAIFFSSQVSGRWYAGDDEGARKASRRAEMWIILSVVLGLVSNTIAIPLMLI